MRFEDRCGHVGYLLLVGGTLLVGGLAGDAGQVPIGWSMRVVGSIFWSWIGWRIKMRSVMYWSGAFACADALGLYRSL